MWLLHEELEQGRRWRTSCVEPLSWSSARSSGGRCSWAGAGVEQCVWPWGGAGTSPSASGCSWWPSSLLGKATTKGVHTLQIVEEGENNLRLHNSFSFSTFLLLGFQVVLLKGVKHMSFKRIQFAIVFVIFFSKIACKTKKKCLSSTLQASHTIFTWVSGSCDPHRLIPSHKGIGLKKTHHESVKTS